MRVGFPCGLLPFSSLLVIQGKVISCLVRTTLLEEPLVLPLPILARSRTSLRLALGDKLLLVDELAPLKIAFAADLGQCESSSLIAFALPFELLRRYLVVDRVHSARFHMRFLAKVLLSQVK